MEFKSRAFGLWLVEDNGYNVVLECWLPRDPHGGISGWHSGLDLAEAVGGRILLEEDLADDVTWARATVPSPKFWALERLYWR